MADMTVDDAKWLGGLLDGFGEIGWRKTGPVVIFKTAYPDRLRAIEQALGLKRRSREREISGDSVRPQWIIEIRGMEFFMLMNAVAVFMRSQKRDRFELQYKKWQAIIAARKLRKAVSI